MLCLVYILVETAQDKMRMWVWRVHSSHLPFSRPLLISSPSSRRHVGKSVPNQRKREYLKCLTSLTTILAWECECLHSYVLSCSHLAKSFDEYPRRVCKPGIRMHSPLTFHSYLKPATSPKVPKMYNKVQNLDLFSIDLDVTQLIFHHIPLKRIV